MQQNSISLKVRIRNLGEQQPFALNISLNQKAKQIVEAILQLLDKPRYKIVTLYRQQNEEIINQDSTLEKLNLQNEEEVEISFSNKANIQIKHSHFGQHVKKQVELWSNPNDLKNLILKHNQMETCQYQVFLLFNGHHLNDHQTLQQQGIVENSLIDYSIKTKLKIWEQNRNQNVIDFEVSETLEKLYEIVKIQLNLQGNFYLKYEGERLNSTNDVRFFSLKIPYFKFLLLVLEKTQLRIKFGNGMQTISVDPEIQIKEVESKVKKIFHIEAQFNLVHEGSDLDSQKTVRDCNFQQYSQIEVEQINECPQQIIVYIICQSDPSRRKIFNADVNQNIDVLNSNFEDEQVKYYYNDQQLDKHKTFRDQNVKNDAHIFYKEILGVDINIKFINSTKDEIKWDVVKTNQKLSRVILDFLNFPEAGAHPPYCVIHSGVAIDNPEDTFDELKIQDQDVLTYCSHKLLLKVFYEKKNINKNVEVDLEATIIELCYVVKREFDIQCEVDLYQNQIFQEFNIKLKTLGDEFVAKDSVYQQPQQSAQQQPGVLQQYLRNPDFKVNLQQQQQPPQNYQKKIVLMVIPYNFQVEIVIDIREPVSELVKLFKNQQQLSPNQPMMCSQAGKCLEEQSIISSLQSLEDIVLELAETMMVFFQRKNSPRKDEIQVRFKGSVEQVEYRLQINLRSYRFIFKDREIDIKKSFEELLIAQWDIIYYEDKPQPIISVINCIIEYQNGQEERVKLSLKQTIKDLKNLCNLNNTNKQLYIKANNIKVFENQEVGQLSTNGELLLFLKDVIEPPHDIPPDINVTIIIGKQKKKLSVSQRNNNTIEGLKQQILSQCASEVTQQLKKRKDREYEIKLYWKQRYLDDERPLQEYKLDNCEIEAITLISEIKTIYGKKTQGKSFYVTDQIISMIESIASKESWGTNLKGNNYSSVKLYNKEGQQLDINKKFYECNIYHKEELTMEIQQN